MYLVFCEPITATPIGTTFLPKVKSKKKTRNSLSIDSRADSMTSAPREEVQEPKRELDTIWTNTVEKVAISLSINSGNYSAATPRWEEQRSPNKKRTQF